MSSKSKMIFVWAAALLFLPPSLFSQGLDTAPMSVENFTEPAVLIEDPTPDELLWRFSWSILFSGALKFDGNSIGYNPIYLYNDRMMSLNTFKLNWTLTHSELLSTVIYLFLNMHLRNIYSAEEPETGDFLYRNRYGVGVTSVLSFTDFAFKVSGEYRLQQSNWDQFKHRLNLTLVFGGSGVDGLKWELEQRLLPYFTKKAGGFSEFEAEGFAYIEYDFFKIKKSSKTSGFALKGYNDFYYDVTVFPNVDSSDVYFEETVGLKADLKGIAELNFGPTYFYNDSSPYEKVNLFGFKTGVDFSFKSKAIEVNGGLMRAATKYTVSAAYWGARNFQRDSWDQYLRVAFAVSSPGVDQRLKK